MPEAIPSQPAPARPETHARLFFALWPDDRVRASLDRLSGVWQKGCGGRRARAEAIHVTLAFLGETDLERLDELARLAANLPFEPCDWVLDQAAWWKRNRIAWAGSRDTPAPLAQLGASLMTALAAEGFPCDRKPFVPHVTLLRDSRCRADPPMPSSILWRVRDFVLVRSRLSSAGAAYEIIGRWPRDAS